LIGVSDSYSMARLWWENLQYTKKCMICWMCHTWANRLLDLDCTPRVATIRGTMFCAVSHVAMVQDSFPSLEQQTARACFQQVQQLYTGTGAYLSDSGQLVRPKGQSKKAKGYIEEGLYWRIVNTVMQARQLPSPPCIPSLRTLNVSKEHNW
jgi:hypothetical protein